MTPAQLIAHKRDGGELSDSEIQDLIRKFTMGELPDYQMSALAMAIYFQGMTTRETVTLTRAFLDSGTRLEWDGGSPIADKHSTGGIGDKVSLVLAPILACCGLHVPMLSGRGLGITGGTLDKLESFRGFRTELSIPELQLQVQKIGCAITGASSELAPADRKLYALRDVTGTVPSRPLIVSSIMSKKLAEGLGALVLDVKVGSGAFMKTEADARLLAADLVAVGEQMGVPTTALLTDMEQPLGFAIGNAIEVREAMACLQSSGPADVLELSIRLGAELLLASGLAASEPEALRMQLQTVTDGSAFKKFGEMIRQQGGDFDSLRMAECYEVASQTDGWIHAIDAAKLGNGVIQLGGGRQVVEDKIDHGVGFELQAKVGSRVKKGDTLMYVYSAGEYHEEELLTAFEIQSEPVEKRTLILDRITG